MRQVLLRIRKITMVIMVLLCVTLTSKQMTVTVQAYTQEEIDAAKAWLSANGYSPDAGGAYAAYADYMNGKFGAIPGLPEPNVKTPPETDQQSEPPKEDKPKEDKPEKDDTKDDTSQESSEPNPENAQSDTQLTPKNPDETQSTQENEPETKLEESAKAPDADETVIPEISEIPLELTASQQEFVAMIDVFAESFSKSEQEEIAKAKERLERQKEERAQAEKEAVVTTDNEPQKRVIVILCAVLGLAILAFLGIALKKKNS